MAGNSDEVVAAIRQVVHGDPTLQAHLFGLTENAAFIAAVCGLASSAGLELEADEVLQAMRAGRQAWSGRNRP